MDCFHKIEVELEHPVDKHTRELLSVNIELLLDYCLRFYDRQFYTREKVNNDVLIQVRTAFKHLFRNEITSAGTTFRPGIFADKVFSFSEGLFRRLGEKRTGKTAQEYIQGKIIELSKEYILGSQARNQSDPYSCWDFPISPTFQSFVQNSKGCTPNEFRNRAMS